MEQGIEEATPTYEIDNSTDYNLDDSISSVKNHEEILKIIEEVKKFEKKVKPFEIDTPEIVGGELVSFREVPFEESEELVYFEEVKRPRLKLIPPEGELHRSRFKLKPEIETQEHHHIIKKTRRESQPATFKIRFNEEGKLENIDFKKPKPKTVEDSKIKKIPGLKKVTSLVKRKGKTGEGVTTEEKAPEGETSSSGRFSKITSIFGKIKGITGIINKLPIPGRKGKESEKPEESKGEE